MKRAIRYGRTYRRTDQNYRKASLKKDLDMGNRKLYIKFFFFYLGGQGFSLQDLTSISIRLAASQKYGETRVSFSASTHTTTLSCKPKTTDLNLCLACSIVEKIYKSKI